MPEREECRRKTWEEASARWTITALGQIPQDKVRLANSETTSSSIFYTIMFLGLKDRPDMYQNVSDRLLHYACKNLADFALGPTSLRGRD